MLARTAEWETPSRYELVGAPLRTEGRYDILGDGVVVWSGGTYPVPVGEDDTGDSFRARAYLRNQVAECVININFVVLDEIRENNNLQFGDAGSIFQGLPPGSQHSAWSFAVPTPAPLPDLNFRAVWSTLQGIGDFVADIGRVLARLFGNEDTTIRTWRNPYRSRDFPTNVQVGGVVVRPGFIPLKDVFSDRVSVDAIRNINTSTLGDLFEVNVKPFGAAIRDGHGDVGLPRLLEDYGVCAVFMPRNISNNTVSDTLTVEVEDFFGYKESVTFPIHCANLSGSGPGRVYGGIDNPEENVLSLGAGRFQAFQGTFQDEIFLSPSDPQNNDFIVHMPTMVMDEDTLEIFSARLQNRLGIYDSTKGSAFQYLITGKAVSWQVSWATADASGSLVLLPSSWYENLIPAALLGTAFRLVTNIGYTPTGTQYSSTIPVNVSQTNILYGNETQRAALGPHLLIQGFSEGFFRIIARDDAPGSTIVQIRPYVHEWNSFNIPLPLGPLARRVLALIAGRLAFRRLPAEWTRRANELLTARGIPELPTEGLRIQEVIRSARTYYNLTDQRFRAWATGFYRAATSQGLVRQAGLRVGVGTGEATFFRTAAGLRAYSRQLLGVQIGTQASTGSAQAGARQALLQQEALTRESNITGTGINRINFEGLFFPPALNRVYWLGDYICCRFSTLPSGSETSDIDRLPSSIPPEAVRGL